MPTDARTPAGGRRRTPPGVEIEVTPAGKTTKRLSLLSGGEKSLVALGFLFAVFLARPCPFYILDEVEAALDDRNIDRFLRLVRGYSDRSQFIVITHQRRTMEAADVLYGVSMGGDGISKVVSRRLESEPRRRRRGARGSPRPLDASPVVARGPSGRPRSRSPSTTGPAAAPRRCSTSLGRRTARKATFFMVGRAGRSATRPRRDGRGATGHEIGSHIDATTSTTTEVAGRGRARRHARRRRRRSSACSASSRALYRAPYGHFVPAHARRGRAARLDLRALERLAARTGETARRGESIADARDRGPRAGRDRAAARRPREQAGRLRARCSARCRAGARRGAAARPRAGHCRRAAGVRAEPAALQSAAMARSWQDVFDTGDGAAPLRRPSEAGGASAGFFRRLRENLSKSREALAGELRATFVGPLDDETWERLEEALIYADVGARTTAKVVERLEQRGRGGQIASGEDLVAAPPARRWPSSRARGEDRIDVSHSPSVILTVGVNGTGKTTTIGKVAWHLQKELGLSVIMAAGDTYRAAAQEQLARVGGARGLRHRQRASPGPTRRGRVRRDRGGAQPRPRRRDRRHAGRLHTQVPLMEELAKVRRVIEKQIAGRAARDAADGRRHHRPERPAPGEAVQEAVDVTRRRADEARRHGQGRDRAGDRRGARPAGEADRDRRGPRGPAARSTPTTSPARCSSRSRR